MNLADIVNSCILIVALQLFALPAYKGLDYNAKKANKKLIEINKFKWLFIHYKENSNKIGKFSFIMQLVHYFICILVIIIGVKYIVSPSQALYVISIVIYLSYLSFSLVFMVVVIFQSLKIDEKLEKEKNINSIKDNEKGKD